MKKIFIGIGGIVMILIGIGAGLAWRRYVTSSSSLKVTPTPTIGVNETPGPVFSEAILTVNATGFLPKSLTVQSGTKVLWNNMSGKTINISSDYHPTHLLYPMLNIGEVLDGESVSLIFDTPGTYTYHNHLDSTQTGTIIVE